jgi:hypothetical protein
MSIGWRRDGYEPTLFVIPEYQGRVFQLQRWTLIEGNSIEQEISLVDCDGYCPYKCSTVNTLDLAYSIVRNAFSKMMSPIFVDDGEWLTAHFVRNTMLSFEIGAGSVGPP